MKSGGGSRMRRVLACCALVLALLAALAPVTGAATEPPVIPPPPVRAPTVAYVTQSGAAPPSVWTIRTDGTQRTRLGAGYSPLIAPSGQQVAASLFGTSANEKGPALAIYWADGSGRPPLQYLDLAQGSALPLAWSRDLRYVAVAFMSNAVKQTWRKSGLAIVDIGTNTAKLIATGEIFGASFAPNGSDEVVYGRAVGESLTAPVNLYRSKPDGSQTVALTRDGRSLFPVWGARTIAYDRERPRRNDAPVYQIWLRSPNGGGARRLTNLKVGPLVSGLTPIAISGDNLLAQFVGQDTSEAWTVRMRTGQARRLRIGRRSVQAAGLSGDGKTVLVDDGGLQGPASEGTVKTLPFAGGAPTLIVAHGSQASWNG